MNAYFKTVCVVKFNNSISDTFIQNVSDPKNKFSKNVMPIFRACQLTINMSDLIQIKSEGDPNTAHMGTTVGGGGRRLV